jgi:glycosyltransferase involved in cell wall biosynthesis
MKILIINYECPPLGGGGGVTCFQTARELAKKHDVDYLTSGYGDLPSYEVKERVNIYRIPVLGRKELSTATMLSLISFAFVGLFNGKKLCSINDYDVINAHFVVPSGIPGVFLSKYFKIPLVASLHGGDIYDPSKKHSPHRYLFLRKLILWLLNNSDQVTAQSNNTRQNAKEFYGYNGEIKIIPLGFSIPDFSKPSRNELGLAEDDIILISVGRLVARKGYKYAIEAVSKLKNDKMKYLIIGEGPEEKELNSLIKKYGLENNVTLLGFVSEEKKYQYLTNSDIYLLSSLHEGFGICLMEAMYCGLPIVSTNYGGQTDFLTNGKNAFLVPVEDSSELAGKIEQLTEDIDLRDKMSRENRLDVEKFYFENISKEYENLFGFLTKKENITYEQ